VATPHEYFYNVKLKNLISIFPLILLVACSSQPIPQATVSGQVATSESTATPTRSIPTPIAGAGIVAGTMLLNSVSPEPAYPVLLVLAEVIEVDGKPMVAGFDRATAPSTLTESDGAFIFTDVKPGKYALVVDKIIDAFLLNNPKDGGDLLFEVKPGEITDAGTLIFDSLPITPVPPQ
jgi:hypothetical protein